MRSMMMTLGLAVAVTGLAFAAEESKSCGMCPVSGGPAKEDVSMDYKGKKLYFCCDGCPDAVKSEPAKFGGKVNDKTVVEFAGAKVGFCCEKCQAKFEKSSDADKLATVFAKLGKGFTMQDKCPVSGKPINAAQKTEYEGKTVYFCCGGCPDAFKADPAKFAAKLPKEE